MCYPSEASCSKSHILDEMEWKRQAIIAFNSKMNPAELEASKDDAPRRIILLQRNRKTAVYHKVWLLMWGHEVVEAKTPSEVLAMLRRVSAHNMTCDIVFTDGLDYPTLSNSIQTVSPLTKVVQVVPSATYDDEAFFAKSLGGQIDGVLRTTDSVRTFSRVLQMVAFAFDRSSHQEYEMRKVAEMKRRGEQQMVVMNLREQTCYDMPMSSQDGMEDYQIGVAAVA